MTYTSRLAGAACDAAIAINLYDGEKAITLPTGEKAIDNDDAYIIIGGQEPIIRDKREQRVRETYLSEGREYPDTESHEEFMLDAWSCEEICGYADDLLNL
jgi:hypothetical protein